MNAPAHINCSRCHNRRPYVDDCVRCQGNGAEPRDDDEPHALPVRLGDFDPSVYGRCERAVLHALVRHTVRAEHDAATIVRGLSDMGGAERLGLRAIAVQIARGSGVGMDVATEAAEAYVSAIEEQARVRELFPLPGDGWDRARTRTAIAAFERHVAALRGGRR